MKKLKILLTGSNGFIGKNILEQLGHKYSFVAPSHHELDLLDAKAVQNFLKRNKSFDLVIHTAVIGGNRKIPNTADIAYKNLQMFFNIARCQQYFKKMIHLGSGIEFGKEKPIIRFSETDLDKRVPKDPFGFYKYICAKYIEATEKILNLRLFGIYGKYEDFEIRFISNAICKSILGLPITINRNVYFDYLYVNDFINILDYFIIHNVRYKTYNVGRGKIIDLLTIAHKINKIAAKKSKIIIHHQGLANEYTCKNRRLLKELAGFKFTDFDQSLKELYGWYLSIKDKLKKESFYDDHF